MVVVVVMATIVATKATPTVVAPLVGSSTGFVLSIGGEEGKGTKEEAPADGANVGESVLGAPDGSLLLPTTMVAMEGMADGSRLLGMVVVGFPEGIVDGSRDGIVVGSSEGTVDGGIMVGVPDPTELGMPDGSNVNPEGDEEGCRDGTIDGGLVPLVGDRVVILVGDMVGAASTGASEGFEVVAERHLVLTSKSSHSGFTFSYCCSVSKRERKAHFSLPAASP